MGNKRSSHSSEEKENKDKDEQKSKTKREQPNNDSKATQKPNPDAIQPSVPPDKQPSAATSPAPQPASPSVKAPLQSSTSGGSNPPDLSEFMEDTKNLLLGKFSVVKCRLRPQMVRIYVSAAAVDSEVERNALIERVYPNLRDYCAKKGYEFEVVDLHWGLWDNKLQDEKYLDYCIKEIKNCQAKSTGPNFLSFLNMKYDRMICPSRILASAYDRLLNKVEDDAEKELLSKHYQLDSNAVPPVYVLLGNQDELEDGEIICEVLREAWGKEEKERYLASVLEMEIEEGVFCPQSQSDAVVWLHRRLSKIDANDETAANHIDLLPENNEIDSLSQEQLGQLTKRLAAKVNEGCFLKFDIPWSAKGLDPDGISTHAKYLDELCAKTQKMIEEMVDKAITERQEEEVMAHKIHGRLYQELLHHTLLCQRHTETFSGQSELLSQIQKYLKSNKTQPLIIHGDVGCGKSAAAAMCAKLCDEVLPESACVVRFVGASPESATLNRVLRSVCEQISYLYGEHISVAAKGHKRLNKDLPKLLKRVTDQRPLVVIVDGIDQFPSKEAQTYEWIPHSLPANVKFVLTTRSKDFEGFSQLQSMLKDKATFLEIKPLSAKDITKIRDNTLKCNGRTLSDEQAELLQEALQESQTPLFIKIACNSASRWHSYDSVDKEKLPKDISNQLETMLETLEERYGNIAVGHALAYLTLSRHGLSDAEMNDLLSCDDAVLDEIYAKSQPPSIRRVPTYLWVALCQELGPFLLECVADNHGLRTWAHQCFREVAIKRYVSTGHLQKQFHKAFVDYFQGRWSKKKKPCVKEGGIEVAMERFVLPQPSYFGRHPNQRRFHELVYHAFHSGEKKFVDKYVWDVEWVGEKLQACDVYSVMEDIVLSQSHEDTTNSDIELLEEFLQVSAYALFCDGAQLYTQLQQRLGTFMKKNGSSFVKMKNFIEQAHPPPSLNFMPSRDCLIKVRDEGEASEEKETPKHELSGLFRFKSNKTHMVSVATESGKMVVWNITSQKAERTLTGIQSPRDVRFVDDTRVVVLCNRELRIYNLDTGTFETKLKGIMNQQMPYFSLHDKDHVVALSRNRMYVNMINVSNGEVVSTFKVGEDRFLNSLLVSANGERCVCGDETQKPSPLLVWDLGARKLIYDFRINQHEFVTKMAGISNDGHYVVSVIKELDDPTRNFVIVYDLLSGQLFKKWKPQANTTCVAISSEGLCVVNGCEDHHILVWDLSSGSLKHTLRGHTHAVDKLYLSDDGHRCLSHDSTQMDRSVRMWDLKKGECLATFTPDRPISCCQISADGACAVIGLPGEKEIITLWVRTKDSKQPKADLTPYGDSARMGEEFDLKDKK